MGHWHDQAIKTHKATVKGSQRGKAEKSNRGQDAFDGQFQQGEKYGYVARFVGPMTWPNRKNERGGKGKKDKDKN